MMGRYRLAGGLAAAIIGGSVLVPLTASSDEPPARCGSRDAVIVGTSGDDTIFGTTGDDIIAGLGGNDRIFGLAGNDRICGDVNGIKKGGNDAIDPARGTTVFSGTEPTSPPAATT